MYTSEITLRVRYAETDKMGFVYHGNYAQYFEVARVEALRDLGFSYAAMEEDGVHLPVLEQTHKFLAPATYDQELVVRTFVKELPSVRFVFHYEVLNNLEKVITTGTTTLVFLNAETGRPMKAPQDLIAAMQSYF